MAQVKPNYQGRGPGGGWVNVYTAANPGAGNDIVVQVPDDEIWVVHSAHLKVQAAGGDVTVRIALESEDNERFYASSRITVAAGQTRSVSFANVGDREVGQNPLVGQTPGPIPIPPGGHIIILGGGAGTYTFTDFATLAERFSITGP